MKIVPLIKRDIITNGMISVIKPRSVGTITHKPILLPKDRESWSEKELNIWNSSFDFVSNFPDSKLVSNIISIDLGFMSFINQFGEKSKIFISNEPNGNIVGFHMTFVRPYAPLNVIVLTVELSLDGAFSYNFSYMKTPTFYERLPIDNLQNLPNVFNINMFDDPKYEIGFLSQIDYE